MILDWKWSDFGIKVECTGIRLLKYRDWDISKSLDDVFCEIYTAWKKRIG